MEGKHYHVPQSSALALHLWNFDTEMPKVTVLVYLNSPKDLTHASQLWVLHIKSFVLHCQHTHAKTVSVRIYGHMHTVPFNPKTFTCPLVNTTYVFCFFVQWVGCYPDLSHHIPLFSCQSSCGEILTGSSTLKLTLSLCLDLNRLITQFTLS